MDLGALDDDAGAPHRDLDEDIAAFERSDKGQTRRTEAWEKLDVTEPLEPRRLAEPEPGSELEALAAEASLTDLKSLIPDSRAAAAPAPAPAGRSRTPTSTASPAASSSSAASGSCAASRGTSCPSSPSAS